MGPKTNNVPDRCHRPGQTREVHVHYLLSSHTVDEQMYGSVDQKWAAQRKTVEAILAEAVLANAQLAVAKAVMKSRFHQGGGTAEEAAAKAEEAVAQMVTQLVFGRVPSHSKAKQRNCKQAVKVLYIHSLFEAETVDDDEVALPAEQPVLLPMFAM